MDFDGIIKWFTETLPAMLPLFFELFIAFAKSLWNKTVELVSGWFDLAAGFFKQAWENFPALMTDWGMALNEFAKEVRKSFPDYLPDSVLPFLDAMPDWALFIVAPVVLLLLLIFILKKILTSPDKEEKYLKSVESPEVPTFGEPLPPEQAFESGGNEDNAELPDIPAPERVDPVVRLKTVQKDGSDPSARREPTISVPPAIEEVAPNDAEEHRAPTTIGPSELQTRIREQLGIDTEIAEPANQDETDTEKTDTENLLDTNAERDVSESLNRLRSIRSDNEAGSPSQNLTGTRDEEAAATAEEAEEAVATAPLEPHIVVVPAPPTSLHEEAAGPVSDNTSSPVEDPSSGIPLAALAPDTPPIEDADDEVEEPDVDETDLEPEALSSGPDEEEGQMEDSAASSNVPAPPGPLLATIARLEESLRVNERLAAQDPASAQAQRDVAISMSRLADAMVEAGDLANAIPKFEQSLAISERLAEQNPLSAEALRDVAVSLNRLGDALTSTGDIAGATQQYEMSLSVSKRISEQSPANAQAQRDVWISLNRMGDVRSKAGNIDGAIAHFETGMQISKRLADFNPANVEAQRDLIVSYAKLGEVCPGQGWWAKGLAVCEQLVAQGKLQPADSWMLDDLRRKADADTPL